MSVVVVLGLFVLTVVVFATRWIALEAYSLLLIVVLVVSGLLSPEQAFGSFGNSAVIMIAGVMLMSGALLRNGAVEKLVSPLFTPRSATERSSVARLLGAVNLVSAFINNVAATTLFAAVAERMAKRLGTEPGRYLMPIAFASMTGGVCTLIGTSTNIAVSRAVEGFGLRPLGMFELTPLGLCIAVAGVGYLLFFAPRSRARPTDSQEVPGAIKEFLFEILVRDETELAGRTLRDTDLGRTDDVTVLAVIRGDKMIKAPLDDEQIRGNDVLLVKSAAERITHLGSQRAIEVKSMPREHRRRLISGDSMMMEVTVAHNSPLIGKTAHQWGFRQRHRIQVVALHRQEELLVAKVGRIPLRAGDVLLLYGAEKRIRQLLREEPSILVESAVLSRYHGPRALLSGAVLLAAVVTGAAGWVDLPTAFLGGGALVVALGCLPATEIAAHLDLRFLVMVAAMVTLGTTMETSGAAAAVADGIGVLVGASNPWLLLAAFYLFTVAMTQPLNNAAAALLVLPIAVHAAENAGLSPRPFVVMVTAAASCSFMTPFEPANMLVYAKGHYHFLDFVRVGGFLTLLTGLVCLVVVPLWWPLT